MMWTGNHANFQRKLELLKKNLKRRRLERHREGGREISRNVRERERERERKRGNKNVRIRSWSEAVLSFGWGGGCVFICPHRT